MLASVFSSCSRSFGCNLGGKFQIIFVLFSPDYYLWYTALCKYGHNACTHNILRWVWICVFVQVDWFGNLAERYFLVVRCVRFWKLVNLCICFVCFPDTEKLSKISRQFPCMIHSCLAIILAVNYL